jgi:phage shock protein A
MLKKMVVAGLAVAVGVAAIVLITSPKWRSWVGMQFQNAGDNVDDLISPEDEIARLKFEIKNLEKQEPELRDQEAKLAVDIDNLEAKVDADAKSVEKLKAEGKSLRDALREDSTATKISWSGKEWPRGSVEKQLDADMNLFEVKKKELENEQGLLAQRKENLAKMKEQRASLKSTCLELQTEVAQLESELKAVKIQEQNNAIAAGDNGVSKVRADLDRLKNKVKVRVKAQEIAAEDADGPLHVKPVEDKPASKDRIKRADALFGDRGDKAVAEDK